MGRLAATISSFNPPPLEFLLMLTCSDLTSLVAQRVWSTEYRVSTEHSLQVQPFHFCYEANTFPAGKDRIAGSRLPLGIIRHRAPRTPYSVIFSPCKVRSIYAYLEHEPMPCLRRTN